MKTYEAIYKVRPRDKFLDARSAITIRVSADDEWQATIEAHLAFDQHYSAQERQYFVFSSIKEIT